MVKSATKKGADWTNQEAAVFNSTTKPVGNLWYIDVNNGNGGCTRWMMNDNGTYVTDSSGNAVAYSGTWGGSGTGCVLLANRPTTTAQMKLVSTATSTTVVVTSPGEYLSSPAAIRVLQTQLMKSGVLAAAAIDGTYSQKTFDAIKAFQKKNKIAETGYLDAATIKALSAITLPARQKLDSASPLIKTLNITK